MASDILYTISQAVRRVKFETILKYHKWHLHVCPISHIMLLFVYTTIHKRFVGISN